MIESFGSCECSACVSHPANTKSCTYTIGCREIKQTKQDYLGVYSLLNHVVFGGQTLRTVGLSLFMK